MKFFTFNQDFRHVIIILLVHNQVGARDATFNDFVDAVKQKDGNSEDCRYAILDYEFTLEAQGTEASQR